MRQGPIGNPPVCTGCEFSNKKLVVGGLVGEGRYTGNVFHCLHGKAKKGELRADDGTPSWCPFIGLTYIWKL